jgi:hypothetical protein
VRLVEESIQISAQEMSSEVACHHAIHIYHRNNFEDDLAPQLLALGRTEILDEPVQKPTCLSFSRVQATHNQANLLLLTLLLFCFEDVGFSVGNCEYGNLQAPSRQVASIDFNDFGVLLLYFSKFVLEEGVGIRNTVGKINVFILDLELVVEGQSIEIG